MPQAMRADSGAGTASEPAALPAPLTPLIGRRQEAIQVAVRLRDPATRLLTLTGPPGIGKTRLGLQVAANWVADGAGPVAWVPLAPIARVERVRAAIARALDLHEGHNRPLRARLQEHLRAWSGLLVLDNCEQVAQLAPLVADLLAGAPGLKVLATSRAPLHVYGEQALRVPALDVPDPRRPLDLATLARCEAVALFVGRAQAVQPGFALTPANAAAVAAVCAQLDGLPLAIELAAARCRFLTPQALQAALAQRLPLLTGGPADRPARQQTLRGALDWSYALLSPAERLLFVRLAVFAGGGTRAAAEAVCGPPGSRLAGQVPALLESLAEQSLIAFDPPAADAGAEDEPRFSLLATIREYAADRLAAAGESDALRTRHAHVFRALAEAGARETPGPAQAAWLARLDREHDNLLAALDWSVGPGGDPAAGLGLAVALAPFWELRGTLSEGRERLAAALAAPGGGEGAPGRAPALIAAAQLAVLQGDDAAAAPLFAESLALAAAGQDLLGQSHALAGRGHLAMHAGDLATARTHYEASLALRTAYGDPRWIAPALAHLGDLAYRAGDACRARALHEDALAQARRSGDSGLVAGLLLCLSFILAAEGTTVRALALLDESRRLFGALDGTPGLAGCLALRAQIAAGQGQPAWAVRLFAAAQALCSASDVRLEPPLHCPTNPYLSTQARLCERLGAEAYAALWAQGSTQSPAAAMIPLAPVATGGRVAEPRDGLRPPTAPALTARELAVLRLVATGLPDARVAEQLVISPATVHVHLRSIYGKLGVSSRTAATRFAVDHQLV